jgi:hypothetical protein
VGEAGRGYRPVHGPKSRSSAVQGRSEGKVTRSADDFADTAVMGREIVFDQLLRELRKLAKPYQVKQVRRVLVQYKLAEEGQ